VWLEGRARDEAVTVASPAARRQLRLSLCLPGSGSSHNPLRSPRTSPTTTRRDQAELNNTNDAAVTIARAFDDAKL
jgi:hypothetical protein